MKVLMCERCHRRSTHQEQERKYQGVTAYYECPHCGNYQVLHQVKNFHISQHQIEMNQALYGGDSETPIR